MSKKFFIYITSQQTVDGQTETSRTSAPCSYELKNGTVRLTYETDADGQKMHSTIFVDSTNKVTISQGGAFSSDLVFEKDIHRTCIYKTEFGNIEMGIFAREITLDIAENSCQIELIYSLDVGGNIFDL